jgi:tetratricopeptide (TPR) repeat protein
MTRAETPPGGQADPRVAGYLGRVLDEAGAPVGTCFQVAPGVLVTAWHVLEEVGAAAAQALVRVDPLAGGGAFGARVERLDAVHDLAVLVAEQPLPAVAGPLVASDPVELRTKVRVTGHAVVDDPGRRYRYLVAAGEWAAGTTRDDAVPLGRLTANALMPGMSGAPVIRDRDNAVVGVVSGRYNSADEWLKDSVWVARTEDLAPLLAGFTGVTLEEPSYADAVDLVFTVTLDQVRLTGPGVDVSAAHGGVRPGLLEAAEEVRRSRARAGLTRSAAAAEAQPGKLALSRAGRLLAESFLPEPVAAGLKHVLNQATQAHVPVRVGLAVAPELAGLPWEALPEPAGQRPLALHPLVTAYRRTQAGVVREIPGPLRIVVAIAAPDEGGGPVLDYERELRDVLAAVRGARQGEADVRIVPFASPAAIRATLDQAPAHVLHISGHGGPGVLQLETADGAARAVAAEQFLEEAIPPGKMPPMIVLAACYTDAAAAQGAPSFAARLCQQGAAVVIGTETSVTDVYATRVFARLYRLLARAAQPDAVAALAEARREVQRELAQSPSERDKALAAMDEWAVVTVLAAAGTVPVFDPAVTAAVPDPPPRPRIGGLGLREAGYFVGRRPEQRHWPHDLVGDTTAGLVIHGVGGIGKTTLAAEIAGRVLGEDTGRLPVILTGSLTLESLLGHVISTVRRELLVLGQPDQTVQQALEVVGRVDLGWADRLAVLREHVLDRVPLLVVLDNFEDNLQPNGTSQTLRDEVLAGLLAKWVADPGRSRLLVTSRFPFTLPGGAERALLFRPVGPLSLAETMKLAWSLTELDKLDENRLDRVWRLVGGHPRSLEYLDALLAGGKARYPDVTARLTHAVGQRLGGARLDQWLTAHTGLDAALAEVVTLAADDVLLDRLLARLRDTPGAEDLLLGASVYRDPADTNALLFQVGQRDEAAASVPDLDAAQQRIVQVLTGAGITIDDSLDLSALPPTVQAQLAPHLAEYERLPDPPYRRPPSLPQLADVCQASSLLTVTATKNGPRYFVHRWTATQLAQNATRTGDPRLAQAHRDAAAYRQWRVQVWPQDRAADLHDLLEARYHLLQAGDTGQATELSEAICNELHTQGAWDEEYALIYDTLTRLPADSLRHAAWYHQLGILAQDRGDYQEAERQYRRSLEINERLGNQADMATGYHQLGMLAQDRGDYEEAERQYRRSLDIKERLGNQAGMAIAYHQLGMLAQLRGDYEEADRQYRRSLDIKERLGHQAGMATSYHQLGMLAELRGDYEEAERQYRRSLDIEERRGNQAGIATSYHQLGMLAQARGNYEEAERQYRRSLDISERLGGQAGIASSYHNLGILAQLRGDYEEAERQARRSLEIKERLGDQAGMASTYGQLGLLAQLRGDYEEAGRQTRRALDILERLGDQAGMANGYSQLGDLEAERGNAGRSITWHVQALAIRLRLRVPQATSDLRRLEAHRAALGPKDFAELLTQAAGKEGAKTITSIMDQLLAADTRDG